MCLEVTKVDNMPYLSDDLTRCVTRASMRTYMGFIFVNNMHAWCSCC